MDDAQIIHKIKSILLEHDNPDAYVRPEDTLQKIQEALNGKE